jgi:hypothetical protein
MTVGLAPGVDVMITIFAIFDNFRRKKMAFLSKTNVSSQKHLFAIFSAKKFLKS